MGYYISHMIGIRTGGVFSDETNLDDMRKRIDKLVAVCKDEHDDFNIQDMTTRCMSGELVAHKGSYVVIAGVFNYWNWEQANRFCELLCKEFGTDILHMCWNEETGQVDAGKFTFDEDEDSITKKLRRIAD